MANPPTVGRPAAGFGTQRAQKWVLAAAILSAVMYGFRRIVEPSVSEAPARGGKVAKITGAGSPPPSLSHWAISYGAGFFLLSVLSFGAPEVAASIAMLMVAGTGLTNGTAILTDINSLEGASSSTATAAITQKTPDPPVTHLPGGKTVGASTDTVTP